jgi:hypothetical protein
MKTKRTPHLDLEVSINKSEVLTMKIYTRDGRDSWQVDLAAGKLGRSHVWDIGSKKAIDMSFKLQTKNKKNEKKERKNE